MAIFKMENKEHGLDLHKLADFLDIGSEDTMNGNIVILHRKDRNWVEVEFEGDKIIRMTSCAQPRDWDRYLQQTERYPESGLKLSEE